MDDLDLAERLVRRYSPSGREASAVREFVRIAGGLGYTTAIDAAGNGVARRGAGRPRILYLGHIDTVDGRLPVRRSGGRLRGRGVVDAKGPLIAALLAGSEHRGPGEYRVVAAVGEETDSRGARHLVRGPAPDALIAGEPSGWDGVTIGYKGMLRVEATFRGARSHYSSPYLTAMDRAVQWIGLVRNFVAERRGPSAFLSLSMKVVGLQSSSDGGREIARVSLDLRLPPGTTTDELARRLPGGARGDAIRFRTRIEPAEVRRGNPVVEALVSGIRASGGRPTLWRKGGTSDLNLAVGAWGVSAAAYGPGDARLDHTDRESLSAADLRRSTAVLRTAIGRLCTQPSILRRSASGA